MIDVDCSGDSVLEAMVRNHSSTKSFNKQILNKHVPFNDITKSMFDEVMPITANIKNNRKSDWLRRVEYCPCCSLGFKIVLN